MIWSLICVIGEIALGGQSRKGCRLRDGGWARKSSHLLIGLGQVREFNDGVGAVVAQMLPTGQGCRNSG